MATTIVAHGECVFPKALQVIRVDEQAKRIFLQASEKTVSSPAKMKSKIAMLNRVLDKCKPSWKDGWSASFFSDSKLAGYKTDENISEAVKNGDWGRAYVGEYDRSTQTLVNMGRTGRKTERVNVTD